ncbi:tetratricopeptide repeat-containing sensor histidine kinase [Marivirga sp.]|uniref:tetratricopeptide repeat-containing sensor histidine kinase n=1 Tax=Marivirga sp. TaxID=2018662 RepID=UPI002D7EBA9C|nr:tetratricopeptide repeat-containing sensor histidine kinase [Marivirga sp.]HET8860619.1 tetratricopeptide repeat-containing sensor histidine kinase [Marivirga sp.]
MIILFNIILLNYGLAIGADTEDFENVLKKGDSCLVAENYSCAIQFYRRIDNDSTEFQSETQRLEFYLNYSNALFITGEYPNSLVSYEKLKTIAIQNQNKFYEGKASSGIAHSLWRMTDNVEAIEEILSAMAIFEQLGETAHLIEAANILAGIYVSIEKYVDAREIYQKMLDEAIQSNDSFSIATNYEYLGIVDYYEGAYKSAINYYKKSLAINEKGDNSFRLSINLGNLAEAKMELGEYQEALDLLHQAINLQERHQYKSVLIYSYYTIGKIHTRIQSYDSGLYYYERSLQMMDATSETRDRQDVYRLIAENYAKKGAFKKAYEFHRLHSAEKDSLTASERTRELEEIKTRYEVENKIKENEYLVLQNSEKQKELYAQQELIQLHYTIGILIVMFLVLLLFLAIKLYSVRQTLINANNSKDKLFGIIAHDLKGPIGNIETILSLAQTEKDESRKTEYFEFLNKSIQNLSALTNQLLSWRFSHKGDFNFKMEKVAIKEISDRTIDLFDYQLAEKNIRIINTIKDNLYVSADKNALLTIFRNVISNAVKFTSKGGEIKLEAAQKSSWIEIKIQDNGDGMPKSVIQKVLDGKHIVSSSGTDNEKGSGLGFSIVLQFIKKLKGNMDIHSDEGKGTTVMIKLKKIT